VDQVHAPNANGKFWVEGVGDLNDPFNSDFQSMLEEGLVEVKTEEGRIVAMWFTAKYCEQQKQIGERQRLARKTLEGQRLGRKKRQVQSAKEPPPAEPPTADYEGMREWLDDFFKTLPNYKGCKLQEWIERKGCKPDDVPYFMVWIYLRHARNGKKKVQYFEGSAERVQGAIEQEFGEGRLHLAAAG